MKKTYFELRKLFTILMGEGFTCGERAIGLAGILLVMLILGIIGSID